MGMKPVLKALLFWGIFLVLYGVYRFAPNPILGLIAGVSESNFQHYKAGFFCYLVATAIEYLIVRKRIAAARAGGDLTTGSRYLYSRMAAVVFLPWIMFVLWYIAPAVIGRWPSEALEIVWANVITLVTGLCVAAFEQVLEGARYSRPVKAVLLTLFFVSIGEFVIFTLKLPWADIFVEPDWRETGALLYFLGANHV